jgi:hypothetical protein
VAVEYQTFIAFWIRWPVMVEVGSWCVEVGHVEAGSWGVEAGSWGVEVGSWGVEVVHVEAGSWGVEVGSWGVEVVHVEAGSWGVEAGSWGVEVRAWTESWSFPLLVVGVLQLKYLRGFATGKWALCGRHRQ